MFVSEIIQMFFVPSVFLFIFFILGLFFIFAIWSIKWKRLGVALLIISILFYYIFSITPTADLLLFPLERKYDLPEESESTETIVLLTGGTKSGDFLSSSNLSESTLKRAVKVAHLYFEKKQKPQIIVSGNNSISSENEALSVSKFLQSFDIPEENIILDKESENTYQSAKNVKRMIGEEPFLLVTSAFHMMRSVYLFNSFETNPIPVSCDFRAIPKGGYVWRYNILDFFPQPSNLGKVNLAFHEYLGFSFYYLINYLISVV